MGLHVLRVGRNQQTALLKCHTNVPLQPYFRQPLAQLCLTLCNPIDSSLPGSSIHGIFQARVLEYIAILLQRIFLTQGSNLGLLHCRQILYRLSHQGSLRRQTPAYIYAQNFSSGTNLLSKLIKIQVKALRSFSALKTQFLGSVRSVSNHMLLGVMQNGICLKAYTQKLIVVSQILSYSFIPRINYQSQRRDKDFMSDLWLQLFHLLSSPLRNKTTTRTTL